MSEKNYIDFQLHFDKRVASEYGLPEAVVINSFQKLIGYNKSQGRNYYQGRTWTYNSYEEWTDEKYFSCFSKEQIRRVLESLISQGVLIKGNFNRQKNDKTNWYAFVEEERWIEKDSPIPNYGNDRSGGMPESADQKVGGLFDNETLANSADQKEKGFLSNSTERNLSVNPLPNSTEQKEQSAEIGNETAGIDKPMSRNRQMDLPESATHYQLNTNSFHSFTEEEVNGGGNMKEIVEILTTLVDLEVIECVRRNYHDALKFDFNDTELLDKHVQRLFRMFVGMDLDKMNDANIMRVKKELIDIRPGLTRAVCWIIILRAFTDYPSWDKSFKNVKSLLGRIEKQKQKYLDDLDREIKKADLVQAASDRKNEEKKQIISAEKMQTEAAERVVELIEKHKEFLSAKKINEFRAMIAERKATSAEFQLISLLADKGVEV